MKWKVEHDDRQWHRWFAWFPITDDVHAVWLEKIWRRVHENGIREYSIVDPIGQPPVAKFDPPVAGERGVGHINRVWSE